MSCIIGSSMSISEWTSGVLVLRKFVGKISLLIFWCCSFILRLTFRVNSSLSLSCIIFVLVLLTIFWMWCLVLNSMWSYSMSPIFRICSRLKKFFIASLIFCFKTHMGLLSGSKIYGNIPRFLKNCAISKNMNLNDIKEGILTFIWVKDSNLCVFFFSSSSMTWSSFLL